jgi:YVTN family beta-propeller protein
MSTRSLFLSLAALAALALSACEEDQTLGTVLPPIQIPAGNEAIVYSKHIEPIFLNSCGGSGCHLNGSKSNNLSLDTWADVMTGSDYGAVIVPYSGVKSHLLEHINPDTNLAPRAEPLMPLGRDPLPMEQILTIKRWIDEGAKNDDGEVALADPSRPRAFVTAQSEDKVTAIDLGTERIMRYLTVGTRPDSSTPPEAPHNVTLSPDGRYLFVNLIVGGTVEKYDARNFTKLGSAQVGLSPAQIVVTRDGSTLYVSNFDQTFTEQFINKVDVASMTSSKIDEVGKAPHGVTLSADEKFLYVMNAGGDDIAEIDLSTNEVTRRIPIVPGSPLPPGSPAVKQPYQAVLSKDGAKLWVSCRGGTDVRVVDIAAGKVVDSVTVGSAPLVLGITPDGSQIWVPNHGSDNLTVIDAGTHAVLGTIGNLKTQPHAVGFTADGKTAYVSCENTTGGDLHHPTVGSSKIPGLVYVIDVASRTIRRQIEVGSFAAGVAIGH